MLHFPQQSLAIAFHLGREAAEKFRDQLPFRMRRQERPQLRPIFPQQPNDPIYPGAAVLLGCSLSTVVETFTLFNTLPTLCSTPVATSAIPALRDVSSNC